MKEILIPLNFTTTPTVYDTKQSFSTSDEASGVLTFTTTEDVVGTVASLTIRNASENANRQTVLIERLDVNRSPFSYMFKNPLPFGQYEGTVLLKKNLTVIASASFLFGVNSSLSAEVLPDLVKAYSLDELVENVETEVSNLKDAFNLTVSETVKGVNKTESILQAQENVRYLNEHQRKANELARIANENARIAAELERKDTFDTLVDSEVIEQTVAQEVANEFQQIESTYTNRLLSTEQQLAESVKHTSGYISLKESPFNAVGDGVADDTSAVQSAINYCDANKLALFVPNGTYRLTSVVIASNPIYIFGRGNTGLSSLLGSAQAKFLIDHSGVGIMLAGSYLQFGGGVMEDVAIVCGTNYHTDTTMVGLSVYRFNHVSFNRVSFQDFRAGSGVKFISGADFAGQYSSFADCKFGMCLIGAFIQEGNGVQFLNCMFDGNNNGSWIDNYTTGVPDNSFGVYAIGGDSHKVSGCRFQGFSTGVYLNINNGTVHDTRFEMCAIGSHFGPTSQKCTLGTGCKNNNYLLLGKNGLQPTDRFGLTIKNEGSHNTIMPFEFASCYAISEAGTNTLRRDVQHVRIFVPEISTSKIIPFAVEPYFAYKTYRLRKVRISASNFGSVDTSYSNRWTFLIYGKYVETTGALLTNNMFFTIGDSPDAKSDEIATVTCNKNESATTLTDVIIDLIIEPY